MNFSEDRLAYWAQLIIDGIWNDDLVDYADEDTAMRVAKRAAQDFKRQYAQVDETVRTKIASLKRQVVEGSPEWDVLYGKYLEEESKRRGI